MLESARKRTSRLPAWRDKDDDGARGGTSEKRTFYSFALSQAQQQLKVE